MYMPPNWLALILPAVWKNLHTLQLAQCVSQCSMLVHVLCLGQLLKMYVPHEQHNPHTGRLPTPNQYMIPNLLLNPMLPSFHTHLSNGKEGKKMLKSLLRSNERLELIRLNLTSVKTTHMKIQKQMFGFRISMVVQNMTHLQS